MDRSSIPIITIGGQYLYKDGERFIVRGIVFRPYRSPTARVTSANTLQDPLDDQYIDRLRDDVDNLMYLEINTVWILNHNPDVPHTLSMDLLARNGIYVIFDVLHNAHELSERNMHNVHTETSLMYMSRTIDSVARYRNTLGICVATLDANGSIPTKQKTVQDAWSVMAYLVRDAKKYMRYRNFDIGQRILPVTINDGQWSSLYTDTYHYISSPHYEGRPVGGRIDFYCFVHYVQRESAISRSAADEAPEISRAESLPSSPETLSSTQNAYMLSKWVKQMPFHKFLLFSEDPIPILLSGYGNQMVRPLSFEETRLLYGSRMESPLLDILSGGFAIQYGDHRRRHDIAITFNGHVPTDLDVFHKFRDAMHQAVSPSASGLQKPLVTTGSTAQKSTL